MKKILILLLIHQSIVPSFVSNHMTGKRWVVYEELVRNKAEKDELEERTKLWNLFATTTWNNIIRWVFDEELVRNQAEEDELEERRKLWNLFATTLNNIILYEQCKEIKMDFFKRAGQAEMIFAEQRGRYRLNEEEDSVVCQSVMKQRDPALLLAIAAISKMDEFVDDCAELQKKADRFLRSRNRR